MTFSVCGRPGASITAAQFIKRYVQDGVKWAHLDIAGMVWADKPGLTWDIRRVEGASALSGGVFNMVFTGTGRLVVSAFGTPVVLNTGEAPTYADLQAAIAWSSSVQTRLVRTAGASALIGRGSGEAFQLAFQGQGFLVVQASEGPVVAKHNHGQGGGGLFS